jgi:mycofactocin precursor
MHEWCEASCAEEGSPASKETKVAKPLRNNEKELEQHQVRSVEEGRDRKSPESSELPHVLEDICIEELAIDGICGVY